MFVFPPLEQTGLERVSDTQALRFSNAAALAQMVWFKDDGISRAEMARISGLSSSTVSTIVNELMAMDLLASSHIAPSKSGRPPAVLRFNHERNHVIGIEMGASHVTVALCDLRGRPLWHRNAEFDVANDPPGTLRLMGEFFDEARRRPEAIGPLLGVGVAVPCPIDAMTPDRLSPRILPAWADVRFAAQLHHRFGARVFVDNDANCGALAEAHHGAGKKVSDFTYMKVATGVGAGHIINGEPYRGFNGIAGEVGHTTVDPAGRKCRCGLRGCLEAEIGSAAIIDKAKQAISAGRQTVLSETSSVTLADIVQSAHAGDKLAIELIAEAGKYLGIAVANLINILNPARVILGGRLASAGDLLLVPLRATLRDRALWTSVERSDVVISPIEKGPIAIGAATLVLRSALANLQLFQPRAGAPANNISSLSQ